MGCGGNGKYFAQMLRNLSRLKMSSQCVKRVLVTRVVLLSDHYPDFERGERHFLL